VHPFGVTNITRQPKNQPWQKSTSQRPTADMAWLQRGGVTTALHLLIHFHPL
jgi:hypothetical protein